MLQTLFWELFFFLGKGVLKFKPVFFNNILGKLVRILLSSNFTFSNWAFVNQVERSKGKEQGWGDRERGVKGGGCDGGDGRGLEKEGIILELLGLFRGWIQTIGLQFMIRKSIFWLYRFNVNVVWSFQEILTFMEI